MKRLLSISLILFSVVVAYAQLPKTLSYQGKLSDASGPLNGTYSLTFTIYDAATSGNSLWTETANNQMVSSGILSVSLGKINPINITGDKPMWLGITVGSNPEISPRVELTGSLYALGLALPFAGNSNSPSSAVDVTNTGTGSAGMFTINNASSTAPTIYSTTNGLGRAGLFETTNANNPNRSLYVTSNTNVQYIDAFTAVMYGTGGAAGAFDIENTSSTASALFSQNQGNGDAAYFTQNGTSGNILSLASNWGIVARVDKSGEGFFNAITATGKVQATQFVGDGSLLTNVGCPAGFTNAGGVCVNFQNDNSNCSGAGILCGTGTHCENGYCVPNVASRLVSGGVQNVRIADGTQGLGKVLTSDANGYAAWATPSGGGWGLSGTAGTIDGTNFIGTTDDIPLNFRVNNQRVGRIENGDGIGRNNANSFFGYLSGNSTTGPANTASGFQALQNNTTGGANTALGLNALAQNTTGSNNTAIGANAGVPSGSTLTNATVIGANAIVNSSNSIQLGNNAVTDVYIGTGTTATLHTGSLQISGGTPGVSKVLTSDANGFATWATPSGGGWGLTGTSGTVDGTSFIGTTDNVALNFRVNNVKAGRIDPNGPIFLGYLAGNANTQSNTLGLGYKSLSNNTTGNSNSAIGYLSLTSNTTGSGNTSFGSNALSSNTTADGNTAIGASALAVNTTGVYNTAIGISSMPLNTTGQQNVAVGWQALKVNTGGVYNTAVGSNTMQANTTGQLNNGFGSVALGFNTTGANNNAFGYYALATNITGSNNTAIGDNADVASGNLSFATAIGAGAKVSASNSLVLGGTGAYAANVGIGVTAPMAKLDIAGSIKIADGTQGVGKVLSSDANGLAAWAIPSSSGWGLTGTAGTTDGINFIGTTDNVPVNFKVNSQKAGRIDASGVVFLGYLAGNANTSGLSTGIGFNALAANTTGANTALGYSALKTNTSGSGNNAFGLNALAFNSTGTNNVAFGNQSLQSNTTSSNNSAFGTGTLVQNTTGANNTAIGTAAMQSNTTASYNSAFGSYALAGNVSGTGNTATGFQALVFSTGNNNTASGYSALQNTTAAAGNSAFGASSLFGNTTGSSNVGVGSSTLITNTTGGNNTALGTSADVATNNLTNATAIGFAAIVNSSNKVRIGNSSVTVIEGQVGFTAASDQRLKKDIQTLPAGLDFILKLKPVSYKMRSDETGKMNWGFIAQDIEKLIGTDNALLTIGGDKDRTLGLRYTDFVAPLVKAVQEQQKVIDDLQGQNSEKDKKLQQLEASIDNLKTTVSELNNLKAEIEKIKNSLGKEASASSNAGAKK